MYTDTTQTHITHTLTFAAATLFFILLLFLSILIPCHFILPSCTLHIYLKNLVLLHIDLVLVLPVYISVLVYFIVFLLCYYFVVIVN